MILFTGTHGTMTLIIMILFIPHHGTPQHGHIHGTGDGVTAGIRLTAAGVIHLTTVHGTALITAGDIPTTTHGIVDIIQAITAVTTTADGMPTQKTTGTAKEEQPEQMYVMGITNHTARPPLLLALMVQQPKAVEMAK